MMCHKPKKLKTYILISATAILKNVNIQISTKISLPEPKPNSEPSLIK